MSRQTLPTFLLAALLAIPSLTACHSSNYLPEYWCKLKAATIYINVPTEGDVKIHTGGDNSGGQKNNGGGMSLTGLAGTGAAIAGSVEEGKARTKLRQVMPKDKVKNIAEGVVAQEAPKLGFPVVQDKEQWNTRLNVQIRSFGIVAASDREQPHYQFYMDGVLHYTKEGKQIWTFGVLIDQPLDKVHVSVGGAAAVGDIQNIAAIANMSPEQMEAMFTQITKDATKEFMERMTADYNLAKGEGKCTP
ncbi:MAG: hypothetical protein JWM74_5570 [Myxococcaceae bacterium]|nr:hypothetical protein [Myxococcaceae bacterium]